MQGLRQGDWKIARQRNDQPWELYNLAEDICECRDLDALAKEAGKLRLEGKDYIVQDGDVIYFLFHV